MRRAPLALIVALMGCITFSAAPRQDAQAASPTGSALRGRHGAMALKDLCATSELIVEAEITAIEFIRDERTGVLGVRLLTLTPLEVLKGEPGADPLQATGPTLNSAGSPAIDWQVGRRMLFFLRRDPEGVAPWTLTSRTFALREGSPETLALYRSRITDGLALFDQRDESLRLAATVEWMATFADSPETFAESGGHLNRRMRADEFPTHVGQLYAEHLDKPQLRRLLVALERELVTDGELRDAPRATDDTEEVRLRWAREAHFSACVSLMLAISTALDDPVAQALAREPSFSDIRADEAQRQLALAAWLKRVRPQLAQ